MKRFLLAFFVTVGGVAAAPVLAADTGAMVSVAPPGAQPSAYETAPADRDAVYFTPQAFPAVGKSGADVSDALQAAIDGLKTTRNYGIVFIPEGTYRISKTIYVPPAVRLIGYGRHRPSIVLAAGSPAFAAADPQDAGQGRYMIWFIGDQRQPGKPVADANPGTFYSGISNIDLRIEDGNPAAVALRTHFAQHGIVSHVDIDIGNGKAGVYDVGNEMQDVRFFGGDYGIYTTKPSPGWPFMMLDTYFEGQRRAAIRSREAGLTIVRMHARKVRTVLEVDEGQSEKLYLEGARLEDVSGPAIVVSAENNSFTQINLRDVNCRNVPVLVHMRESGRDIKAPADLYHVASLTHGQQMDSPGARPAVRTTQRIEKLAALPALPRSDIPDLPKVGQWADVRVLGARGDGATDDTAALQAAIDRHPVVYLPAGRYRVTDTIRLKPDTVLIGLHPMATQIVVRDNTAAFSGFGAPRPLLDVPGGGRAIVTGIGLDAGGSNPRAVAAMWRSGAASYMNDVKFVGGHGTMAAPGAQQFPVYNDSRTADGNPARRWDTQYPSLWVRDGGGGVFRNIWSASPYASAGFYVSDTATPGRVYALSVEHHVRNEIILRNVANWRLYDIQTEEEIAESQQSQPLEIVDSHDLSFANLYTFRVIWLNTPYAQAIRTWGSGAIEFLNVHNFTQTKYSITNTLNDMASMTEVRPWELARLAMPREPAVRGRNANVVHENGHAIERLASGFEFADGMCADADGNVFFVDSRLKRIYQWSAARNTMRLVGESHWKPLSLACGRDGKLNVVVEYWPVPGATTDGQPESMAKPADAEGTSYAFWYHPVAVRVYAIDPRAPDATFQALAPRASDPAAPKARVFYPANRWRDGGDYLGVTRVSPPTSVVLSDGASVLPVYYDLLRANALLEAVPGRPFFAVDEYMKRVVRFNVTPTGALADPRVFAEHGEFNLAVDTGGRVYVPDGDIYVYAADGKPVEQIATPERPTNVVVGGPGGRTLYFTSRNALYRLQR
jgi:sugar lactone lactonase YvrE